MDKQMIEEMAKVLEDSHLSMETWNSYLDDVNDNYPNECKRVATVLYNAGYRKIPENAVVLTSNQKISLEHEWYRLGYEQARKETVDKFAEMAKAKSRHAFVNVDDNPREDRFLYLTDVDEICKDITEGL